MAQLSTSAHYLALGCGEWLHVYDTRTPRHSPIKALASISASDTSASSSTTENTEADNNSKLLECSDAKSNGDVKRPEETVGQTLSCDLLSDSCDLYAAVAFNNHSLTVSKWNTTQFKSEPDQSCVFRLPKQVTVVKIMKEQDKGITVLAADRFGYVMQLKVFDEPSSVHDHVNVQHVQRTIEQHGDSVLLGYFHTLFLFMTSGHLSLVLDVCVVQDADADAACKFFVVSCDRDNKVRVSEYPHSYKIRAFCLGHTAYVSSISTVHNAQQPLIVSGSGDGSVRVWTLDGLCVHTSTLQHNPSASANAAAATSACASALLQTRQLSTIQLSDHECLVAVCVRDQPLISLLRLQFSSGDHTKCAVSECQLPSVVLPAECVDVWQVALMSAGPDTVQLYAVPHYTAEHKGPVLLVYEYNKPTAQCSLLEGGIAPSAALSEALAAAADQLPALDKLNCYDNATIYQETKQRRLAKKPRLH